MNSHEIIQRTLNYGSPVRVARSFHESDFVSASIKPQTYAREWKQIGISKWESVDMWGNIWQRVDPVSKGEVVLGVLESWDMLGNYTFPNFSNFDDYALISKTKKKNPDKWLLTGLPGFTFNIARKFRKLDQYLVDLCIEPDHIRQLHDRIDCVLEEIITHSARAGADAIMFCEDWGTQSGTLINPDLWEEEFYPRFVRLCRTAHENGLKVFMHSCGNIGAIVPRLIEAGIDVLQFDQPDLHGIDTLASYQEDLQITFWCPVDIQKTLQTRDETIIRNKAREMVEKLWQGRGGFIAGYYSSNEALGLDSKWQKIACEEFAAA